MASPPPSASSSASSRSDDITAAERFQQRLQPSDLPPSYDTKAMTTNTITDYTLNPVPYQYLPMIGLIMRVA